MTRTFPRAFLVLLLIIAAETLNGTVRELVLSPYLGSFRARQIGVFAGSAIIFALTYLFLQWIGETRHGRLWCLGLMWAACTVSLEFTLGRLAFRYSWRRILEDYDVSQGGLMLGSRSNPKSCHFRRAHGCSVLPKWRWVN
jgi:hypothetical protein